MNRRNFLKIISASPLLSFADNKNTNTKPSAGVDLKQRKVCKTDFLFQSNLNRRELEQYIAKRYNECQVLQDALQKVGCLKLEQTGTVTMRENGKFDVTIKRRFMK